MEVKIKDWVIKRYVDKGYYLVDTEPTGRYGEIVANKADLQKYLDVDEKELDEILKQVESEGQ